MPPKDPIAALEALLQTTLGILQVHRHVPEHLVAPVRAARDALRSVCESTDPEEEVAAVQAIERAHATLARAVRDFGVPFVRGAPAVN